MTKDEPETKAKKEPSATCSACGSRMKDSRRVDDKDKAQHGNMFCCPKCRKVHWFPDDTTGTK